jgi:2-dehydro-3-deoxyphosphogluconate aldolase/(4S)-4-hydroxy-2-oxoglutarate aldolase
MNRPTPSHDGRHANADASAALAERAVHAAHYAPGEIEGSRDGLQHQEASNAAPAAALAERYRAVHQQGFLPIFVADRLDAVQLAEAAVAAGAKAVEITCRRAAVCDDIRRVRAALPELLVLVGSVVDDGPLLNFLQSQRPRIPSIAQLCDLGVDGFVSALPLSQRTIERLASTHVLVPGVETVTEAVRAIEAGAHFAKFFNTNSLGEHHRVAMVTSSPLYGLLPIFVTGGVTLAKIDPYVEARVALLGSGWDMILGGYYQFAQENPKTAELAAALKRYLLAMTEARARHQPQLGGNDTRQYLRSIPHYHPFLQWIDQ